MSSYTRIRPFILTYSVIAVALLGYFILGVLRLVFDTDLFDPDMLILYGFFRFYDPQLFPHDYTADYLLSLWMPLGFTALQYLWAQFADPIILHRVLPLLLWLACAPLTYFSAKRIGGIANGWATATLYLGSSLFLFRMTASLPHSFGFLFLWWMVAALVSGRVIGLMLATVLSVLFYPIVTPILGMTLAFWLLFPKFTHIAPLANPVFRWRFGRRLILLATIAGMAVLFFMPMLMPRLHHDYGASIDLLTQRDKFPEITNPLAQIPPFFYMLLVFLLQHSTRLGMENGQVFFLFTIIILIIGLALRTKPDQRPAQLRPFLASTLLCFIVSYFFYYDTAYRIGIYTLPVLFILYLPIALRHICKKRFPTRKGGIAFACYILFYVACTAQAQPEALGYHYRLNDDQKEALTFISSLPKDTVIAGWPGDRVGRIAEAVPYVARRQTLITWQGHSLTHSTYVLTMRERMNALVDAYLASDLAPIIALRDRLDVDYLVINEADFAGTEAPYYIPPFTERAKERWEENKPAFIVLQLAQKSAVYYRNGIAIIDLRQLP